MHVAFHDADQTRFPNLALMKLAAHHRSLGDDVSWYAALWHRDYDLVYSSKVFTWTPNPPDLHGNVQRGGSGYDLITELPDGIEHTCPDYSLYGLNFSVGYLTRGCPRRCPWCIVPDKEGPIRAHADVMEFLRHRSVVLLDNNVLACEHGLEQIDKLAKLQVRVDFIQGLDVTMIDSKVADRLAALKWIRFIRIALDRTPRMNAVRKAVEHLRAAGCRNEIRCYMLVTDDIEDALLRAEFLRSLDVLPFAQPYRSPDGTEPSKMQKHFARWASRPALFKTVTWEQYQQRKIANHPDVHLAVRVGKKHAGDLLDGVQHHEYPEEKCE